MIVFENKIRECGIIVVLSSLILSMETQYSILD